MKSKPCTLAKLFRAYEKAEYDLYKRRDEEFPAGTKVMFCEMETEVITGSLYPTQILTKFGHMGWRRAKKITESTDETGK